MEQLPEDSDVTHEEIVDLYEKCYGFKITGNDLDNIVQRKLAKQTGAEVSTGAQGGDQHYEITDLGANHDEEWISLTGQVLTIWDDVPDGIAQKGRIGDDTGTIEFSLFEKSLQSNPSLEVQEGKSYRFESVVGDYYDERIRVRINSRSSIEEVDRSFSPPESDVIGLLGVIVDVVPPSGLIKRCADPDCSYVLDDGECPDHGVVGDHEFDLRIKAILDDGEEYHRVVFPLEQTESLTDISLADARRLAEQEYDHTVVEQKVGDRVLGRHVEIHGRELDNYIVVNEAAEYSLRQTESEATIENSAEQLIEQLQSVGRSA